MEDLEVKLETRCDDLETTVNRLQNQTILISQRCDDLHLERYEQLKEAEKVEENLKTELKHHEKKENHLSQKFNSISSRVSRIDKKISNIKDINSVKVISPFITAINNRCGGCNREFPKSESTQVQSMSRTMRASASPKTNSRFQFDKLTRNGPKSGMSYANILSSIKPDEISALERSSTRH